MNVKRIATTAGAVLLAAASCMTVGSSTASAAAGDCPTAKFCLWENANYSGFLGYSEYSQSSLGYLQSKVSSVKNNTAYTVLICVPDPGAECLAIQAGKSEGDLRSVVRNGVSLGDFDNKVTTFTVRR
ncbi:peptidase inhibitor family I36 protein [Streptomyces sp. NPDC087901]|uniref:peptidase inhibitor family I36 protein n=1 Tax=Streptomyces sp. NPDC087901 TaxID=3365818 RepID=UPI0037F2EC62